jgi:hypothetical protein
MSMNCKHIWRHSIDSYGVWGSPTWSVWNCRKCGDETTEEPDGWEDPREAEADFLRDQRRDDEMTGDL